MLWMNAAEVTICESHPLLSAELPILQGDCQRRLTAITVLSVNSSKKSLWDVFVEGMLEGRTQLHPTTKTTRPYCKKKDTRKLCKTSDWPSWEVCCTEIDEEVPLPFSHGKQILHAPQVGLQKTGSSPDGDHPPRCGPYIWVVLCHLQDFPMHVATTLKD